MLTRKKEFVSNILPTPFIVRESERRKTGLVCHSNISTTYWLQKNYLYIVILGLTIDGAIKINRRFRQRALPEHRCLTFETGWAKKQNILAKGKFTQTCLRNRDVLVSWWLRPEAFEASKCCGKCKHSESARIWMEVGVPIELNKPLLKSQCESSLKFIEGNKQGCKSL